MTAGTFARPGRHFSVLAPLILTVLTCAALARTTAAADCSDPAQVLSGVTVLSGGNGATIVSGDFNGDGKPDLATGGYGKLFVRLNGSFGTTVGYTVGTDPFGVTVGDFNEDGILDLATANTHSDNVTVLLGGGSGGVGDGTFSVVTTLNAGPSPYAIGTGDFNGDGHLDLVATNIGDASLTIWLGPGNGTFAGPGSYATGNGPAGLAIADFNGDGKLDVVVANNRDASVSLLKGNGSGAFQPRTNFIVGVGPVEVAAADLNFDGRPDCVVSSQAVNSIGVLINAGSGSFAEQVAYGVGSGPRGLAVADYNGDGVKDVAVSTQASSSVKLFLGQGGGLLGSPGSYAAAPSPAGAVAADLNGDGKIDLAVVSLEANNLSIWNSLCNGATPVISGFIPAAGAVGDPVSILGQMLAGTTVVRFNGTAASFTVLGPTSIRAIVPPGATTGPISVTTPLGTGVSFNDFFVGLRPVIDSASPDTGSVGDGVTLHGHDFLNATHVNFGGTGEAAFTVVSETEITAVIDSLAVTGPIRVTTIVSAGTSGFVFRIIPPFLSARIFAIQDVRGDEGGFVTVAWKGSQLDNAYVHRITSYRVWRRASESDVTRPSSGIVANSRLYSSASIGAAVDGYWEPLVTLPAAYLDGYAYTAPTTRDSSADENPFSVFFVQALTADPLVFYSSPVDSGYSVDNLAPAQPAPFAAVYGPASVTLHWGASREADLLEYRLYRGPAPDFVPSPANLVLAGRDTGYVDHAAPPSISYKLVAVDRHGNESTFALAGAGHLALALQGVQPNPASRDRVRVALTLPDGRAGTLALIDVSGRRVREREIGSLGTGNHVVDLGGERLAPGVYLLELRQGDRRVTAKAAIR